MNSKRKNTLSNNFQEEILKQIITIVLTIVLSSIISFFMWNFQNDREFRNQKLIYKADASKESIESLLKYKKAVIDRLEYTVISNESSGGAVSKDFDYKEYFQLQQDIKNISPELYNSYINFQETEILANNELNSLYLLFGEGVDKTIHSFEKNVMSKNYENQLNMYIDFKLNNGASKESIFPNYPDTSMVNYNIVEWKSVIGGDFDIYLNAIIEEVRKELDGI